MSAKKYHLERNQQYFFYILYNVHPETLSKLNYRHLKISGMSVADPGFKSLINEISGLQETLKQFLEELLYIKGEKISYVLFSKDEDNLAYFFSFLTILRPSRMFLWVSFETHTEDFSTFQPDARNLLGTFSEWEKIFTYYQSKKEGDLFYLLDQDLVFANLLLRNFNKFYNRNKSFPEINGLYARAYGEDKYYFKYLLLFMIIESLISDSDNGSINYKLRRMCATLIGQDIAQCQAIYKGASDAYTIRSKLVHKASFKIDRSYLLFVHSMVCEILLLLLISGIDKSEVFDKSTQMGFGHRDMLVKTKNFKHYGPLFANSMNLVYPFIQKKKAVQSSSKKDKNSLSPVSSAPKKS
jgi:Apea-like HEPN